MVNVLALELGSSYKIQKQTPLMPSFELGTYNDTMDAIKKMEYLFPETIIFISKIQNKGTTPWYYVYTKLGSGWINSTALLGQTLEKIVSISVQQQTPSSPLPRPNYPERSSYTTTDIKRIEAPQDQVVYVAPNSGKKYHLSPDCRGLNNNAGTVQMSLSEATSKGYERCKICGR